MCHIDGRRRVLLTVLPLLLAACGSLLAPQAPQPPPRLPTQAPVDPGDDSPLRPQR